MNKKIIFLFQSVLLTGILILSTISSNLQNDKSELLMNEIKRTQDYNTNLVTINHFFANANVFYNIENLSNYSDCDLPKFQNYSTCIALKSVDIIDKTQNITNELRYFYFNNSIVQEITIKSTTIFLLNIVQYILLAITRRI